MSTSRSLLEARPAAPAVPAAPAAAGSSPEEARLAAAAEIGDSLAAGVVLLMVLTVVQRGVGFLRGILFCRLLPPEQLGLWDLSFAFLMMAAPVLVLGIPGSFGRYAEHFRRRGHLRTFLRRTTAVSALLAVGGIAAVVAFRHRLAWLLFDDPAQVGLVLLLAGMLAAVVAFNFLTELFTALRQVRIVAAMQLANSLLFAAAGVGLLLGWQRGAATVVLAYGVACLITAAIAVVLLARLWRATPRGEAPLTQGSLWGKLAPFAAWLWVTNIAANLFEAADRYMIVHFGAADPAASAALVGNYHSSRVVPLLMVSVLVMLSGLLLPYLSASWESGRRHEVSDRLNLMLKLAGMALTAGGAAILLAAPLLFGWVFAGKYDGGLGVLPWTLVYCTWNGLLLASQNYLFCAERARLTAVVFTTGLLVNVALNFLLLPWLGLVGAVMATAAANAVALALTWGFSAMLGMRLDRALGLVFLLPLLLLLGPLPALAGLLAVAATALYRPWLLTVCERQMLMHTFREQLRRWRAPLARLSHARS